MFTMLPQCFKLDRQTVKILQKEIYDNDGMLTKLASLTDNNVPFVRRKKVRSHVE